MVSVLLSRRIEPSVNSILFHRNPELPSCRVLLSQANGPRKQRDQDSQKGLSKIVLQRVCENIGY